MGTESHPGKDVRVKHETAYDYIVAGCREPACVRARELRVRAFCRNTGRPLPAGLVDDSAWIDQIESMLPWTLYYPAVNLHCARQIVLYEESRGLPRWSHWEVQP